MSRKLRTVIDFVRKNGAATAWVSGVTVLVVFTLVGLQLSNSSRADSSFGPDTGRPFVADDAWTRPLPTNPVVDPNSAAMVANLKQHVGMNIYEFGIPVYYATSATPKKTVNCTQNWGTCDLELGGVPLDSSMVPHPGSDGAMVVIDFATRKSYEFWQYRWNGGAPTTSWGSVENIDGTGSRPQAPTGAGISRLAGIIRTYEIRNGLIDHPLTFSTSYCQTTTFRYPASKTDGKFSGTGAVPEGAKIQLDPAINVDAIPNITRFEKIVAKALQKYGAYNIDCGGASMGFGAENPYGEIDPYPSAGIPNDYWNMPHIPWGSIRVLAHWHGGSSLNVKPALGTTTTDTTAPTISMTATPASFNLGQSTVLSATATDNVGVSKVEFLDANGAVIASDTTAPYAATWTPTTSGGKSVRARAIDAAGNSATSAIVNITVNTAVAPAPAPSPTTSPPPTTTSGPDLLVTALTATPAIPAAGQKVTFTASIKNQGTTATPSGAIVGVGFWVDNTQILWGSTTTPIPAGGTTTIAATADMNDNTANNYWTATSGSHSIKAWVDDVNRINELNETNNTATVTVTVGSSTPPATTRKPGDANNDGRVNGIDFSLLIGNDGKNYPAGDFNGDGVVGAPDVAILLANWTW